MRSDQPMHSQSESRAQIGVVVIGRNEGERLVRCLASICDPNTPIVYVDSGSTDDSAANAAAAGAHVVHLDMDIPFSAGRARNEGFQELLARFPHLDYVQFIDGDCEFAPRWLTCAAMFLDQNSGHAIVCGRRREKHPESSVFNMLCDVEWDTPIGDAAACGGDFLARVAAFNVVGGFNPALIAGEEPEMCYRLGRAGWLIHRLDEPMTLHDAAITRISQWARRSSRSGYAYAAQAWLHWRDLSGYCWRENLRNIVWGFVYPISAIVAALFVNPWFLILLLAYPLQFIRTWFQTRRRRPDAPAHAYAFYLLLGKWTELYGQTLFAVRAAFGRNQALIEYK